MAAGYSRRWARQPTESAGVNPALGPVTSLWVPASGGITDAIDGRPVTLVGGASVGATDRGFALRTPTSGQYATVEGDTVHAPTGSAWSFAVWARLLTLGGANRYKLLALLKSDGASTSPFSIFASNAAAYLGWNIGAFNTWARLRTNVAVTLGEWTHIGVSFNGGDPSNASHLAFYLNGKKQAMSSSSAFSASTQRTQFSGNAANQQFEGEILGPISAPVAWTDEEFAALFEQHWRAFAPRRIWVPQAAITGAPTLSAAEIAYYTSTTARPRVTLTF